MLATTDKMHPSRPKRSRLVTILALVFLGWGAFVALDVIAGKAWDLDSGFWDHSDAMWAWEYVGGPPTPEQQRLSAAQASAQMRYELPIKGTLAAWSLVGLVASLGILRRKNWARVLFIGLMAFAVLGVTWGIVVFTPLRLADKTDIIESVVIAVVCGSIAWKLRSPSIISEFRDERP